MMNAQGKEGFNPEQPQPNGQEVPNSEQREKLGTKPFREESSFGPTTPEVVSMINQAREGRPTAAYEFAQGMVDYGATDPPPRIYLVYEGGERREFSPNEPIDREGLEAIEFTNHGAGLTPENVTMVHHGGGEETLGQWGRGTLVSLTYLESQGMTTEIESNADDGESGPGRSWKGQTSLTKTGTGSLQKTILTGEWGEERSNTTTFRILKPTDDIIGQIETLPQYFLPASPENTNARIVEPNPDAKKPPLQLEITSRDGEIRGSASCFHGVLKDWKPSTSIYVDGLRVDNRYGDNFLYPWSLEGLRKFSYPYGVERDHASRAVSGNGNPVQVIQYALRTNTDPVIFRGLLNGATAEGGRNSIPAEIQSTPVYYAMNEFSEETKRALIDTWNADHPDAILAKDANSSNEIRETGEGKKAVVVQGVMYDWLKEAGIPTAEDELGIKRSEQYAAGRSIRVEYADTPNALTKAFIELAEVAPESIPEVVEEEGGKAVLVRLPYAVAREGDFYDRHKPGAQWLRIASIVGAEMGIDVQCVSRQGDAETNLRFHIKREGTSPVFQTHLQAQERTVLRDPEEEGADAEYTAVTLRGDILQNIKPPPAMAESLRNIAIARAKAIAHGRQAAKTRYSNEGDEGERTLEEWLDLAKKSDERPASMSRRHFLKAAGALAAGGAIALYYKELGNASPKEFLWTLRKEIEGGTKYGFSMDGLSNYSQPTMYLGVSEYQAPAAQTERAESNTRGTQERHGARKTEQKQTGVHFEQGPRGRSMTGYYSEYGGTAFVRNPQTGRGQWKGIEDFERADVAVTEPPNHATKITVNGFRGTQRLALKSSERIIATDSDDVCVMRDRRTGNYIIEGSEETQDVTLFTAETNELVTVPPIEAETESLVRATDLRQDWQESIRKLRGGTRLSNSDKAAAVLKKWGEGYVYSDNSELDRQVVGDSPEQIMAQMVNTQRGICNTAASGYVGLLREVGVPARVKAGESVTSQSIESHAWAEYWTGTHWEEIEPLHGSTIEPETQKRRFAYLQAVAGSRQSQSSEQLLSSSEKILTALGEIVKNPPKVSGRDALIFAGGLATAAAGSRIAQGLRNRMDLRSRHITEERERKIEKQKRRRRRKRS